MGELTLEAYPSTRLLRVQQASWEAEKVISFRLVDPTSETLPSWQPGSHLDITLPSGLIRQYSLCGNPEDSSTYRIAVLSESHSRGGSKELHQTALVGRTIQIRGPRNHFPLVNAKNYLFIAGGIGITPILPMIHMAEKCGASWRLVYVGHSLSRMAFLSELGAYPSNKVAVFPTETHGRPNLQIEIERLAGNTEIYCCGPSSMISAISDLCEGTYPHLNLHAERFSTTASNQTGEVLQNRTFEVDLRRSGIRLVVPTCRSILDVIRDELPEIPFSCEEGYCGTCETAVLEGIPDHRDTILSPKERKRNQSMMICVSRAHSDRLVLDL